jgi:surface polysaccharide O-acyltransferase-like enzyme
MAAILKIARVRISDPTASIFLVTSLLTEYIKQHLEATSQMKFLLLVSFSKPTTYTLKADRLFKNLRQYKYYYYYYYYY